MTMDLTGPGGDFGFTITSWEHLLKLASLSGWEPAGTLPPEGAGSWDGNYFTNDGQRVADEDARALADALEAALPHIPDLCGLVYYPGCGMLVDDRPAGGLDLSGPSVLPWFSKGGLVPDMIAFARAGGFAADDPGRH